MLQKKHKAKEMLEKQLEKHMAWTCFSGGECKFQTTKKSDAEEHNGLNHIVVKWFVCDECDLRCETVSDLRDHKKQHHPG